MFSTKIRSLWKFRVPWNRETGAGLLDIGIFFLMYTYIYIYIFFTGNVQRQGSAVSNICWMIPCIGFLRASNIHHKTWTLKISAKHLFSICPRTQGLQAFHDLRHTDPPPLLRACALIVVFGMHLVEVGRITPPQIVFFSQCCLAKFKAIIAHSG